MKQGALFGLTIVNLALLGYQVLQTQPAMAAGDTVLRGTGLEIVDTEGRKRATGRNPVDG
jgi:hypothetical protein